MNIEDIARTCHEANRSLCVAYNDFSQKHWVDCPEWQKQSAINGVEFHLSNPDVTPATCHENWSKFKVDEGWVYGEEKSEEKKTHPCLVPYEQLPEFQKLKDHLFGSIIKTLKTALPEVF